MVELCEYFGLLGGHVGVKVVGFLFGRMVLLFRGTLFGLSNGDAFSQKVVGLQFIHVGDKAVGERILTIVFDFHCEVL